MPVSGIINDSIKNASFIRKMFEEGNRLKAQFGEDNVFDFSIGNPDIPPPDEFYKILNNVVSERKEGLHGYMSNAGFQETREAVARAVAKEQDVRIKAEHIIMTCGAAGGLNTALKTILDPGDQVIVPKPYFVEYGFYMKNHNGEMILVNTNNDFSLNFDNIESAINRKTRAVLINSPNNPTGKVYSENEIKALSSILVKYTEKFNRPIYLISDEPYRKIVYDGIMVPSILKNYNQSMIVTSYSKTLSLAGERIGYIAANPSCRGIESLMAGLILSNRILGYVNAPALMQRVIAALPDISVDVAVYKRRRDMLVKGLGDAGYKFSKPEGAFYFFCRSPLEDDVKFVKLLQEQNILVVPGSGFGGPGYFRLSYAVKDKVIENAMPGFRKALQSL